MGVNVPADVSRPLPLFTRVCGRLVLRTARTRCSRLNGMKFFWDRTIPRVFLMVVALFAVLLLGAWPYGAHRWNSETQELRARLDTARAPVRPQTVDFRELEGLPAPVQRYFRVVLEDEQSMVAGVR